MQWNFLDTVEKAKRNKILFLSKLQKVDKLYLRKTFMIDTNIKTLLSEKIDNFEACVV